MTNGNINKFDPSDIQDVKNLENIKQIIFNSIKKVDLDLSDLTVLTEAATGNWISTPLIAAFSNSKKVLCYTKDSQYGTINEITQNFQNISKFLELDNVLHIFSEKYSSIVSEADVVTNSGLLRPLDKNFIQLLKKNTVISLMWEPWELRSDEIDLYECWRKQIPILGVNEHNPTMDIMQYDGEAIIKIISEHDIPITGKKIIIVGENLSALYMYDALKALNANVSLVTKLLTNECREKNIPIIGNALKEDSVIPHLENCDIIIINSIPIQNEIIGENGLPPQKLKHYSPNVSIFVYFGTVNYSQIITSELKCFPSSGKEKGYMNWTIDVLGPQPTIELNTLGLKVGEILARNYNNSKLETEKKSLSSSFCLDFTEKQKQMYYKIL